MNLNNPAPLYQQIYEEIKSEIESGKYSVEERIPSEFELADLYDVSRITIRRAIEKLCFEGYLVKLQGKGTFVSVPHINNPIMQVGSVTSFSDVCKKNGVTAGAVEIKKQIVPARPYEAEFFNIDKHSFLIYLQRVRYADSTPVFEENILVPFEENEDLLQMNLENISIFDQLEKMHGKRPVTTNKRVIEAVKASDNQASRLNIMKGDPLLYLVGYFMDDNNNPIMIGRQYYVGSRYRFVL